MRAALEDVVRQARAIADAQRGMLNEIRQNWQLHVAANARAAGAEQAQAFGEKIAAGLQRRLEELATEVERSTRSIQWSSALQWGLGIAGGMALTIVIGVWALMPSIDGLYLGVCARGRDAFSTLSGREMLVVVKGM